MTVAGFSKESARMIADGASALQTIRTAGAGVPARYGRGLKRVRLAPPGQVRGGGARAGRGRAQVGGRPPAPPLCAPAAGTCSPMPHAAILYAEDNRAVRLALTDLLESEGFRVEACEDGRAALVRIEGAEPYALLLLDDVLPGASGLELTRRARALAHRRATPVVIISASEVGRAALRAGADAFLKKPEDISRVVATVARLTKSRES